MTLSWETVDELARRNDRSALIRLLAAATPAERAAAAPVVEAGVTALPADPGMDARTVYALAVVGTAPSAARAVTLLRRPALRAWNWEESALFLALADALDLPWTGDLGARLAARLPARDPWPDDWFFAAALMRAGGVTPPVTEGVVRSWVRSFVRRWKPEGPIPPLVARLRDDPWRDTLLPAVFEIDTIGADLGGVASAGATPAFPAAVAALDREGTLERKTVLSATVDRLLRGGRPNNLRPFILLHDELAPTVDESSTHALDYARLLAAGPGAVATLAQRCLRAVDGAGRLERETLLEASAETLVRREKTLVKAQLSWLAAVARREPARSGDVVVAIAGAFGHAALDVQERALDLVAKHRDRVTPAELERIAAAAAGLGGDLPARAASLFAAAPDPVSAGAAPGSVTAGPGLGALPPGSGVSLVVAPAVAEMPPPIADAAELAEELAALVHVQTGVGWERVLAALVAFHTAGAGEDLAATLLPVTDRYPRWFAPSRWNAGSPFVALGLAIRAATATAGRSDAVVSAGRGGNDPVRQELAAAVRVAWQEGRRGHPHSSLSPRPDGVLALRVAEVAAHLAGSMVPAIVATPTHVNGSLDAGVLLQRLQRAEAEGWQPWPFDFEQALLRVPRVADDLVAVRAARLTTPAGRQFAQWLASGGLPDPISAPVTQPGERGRDGGWTWDVPVPRRVVATLRPARDGGLRLERQLLTLTPVEHPVHTPGDFQGTEDVLAMVFPHHREVAAAWALAEVAALADQNQRDTARNLFPLLAECTGPVGPAMAYALAYALAAKHESDRAAAVDTLLTLAAAEAPFAAPVGAALADLGSDGTITLTRVLPALADLHRAGASVAVWELLVAALPPLLTTTARTVPDLLELASQVAVTLGVRGDLVPGLAGVAARAGSTRVTKEAKRLQSILNP
ncbi:hypothetical protein AMIS_49210 [Actinoplanes missouriensis 431]|uniref:Secreted protein n=1 Tax=Actinoplanes missouriensis (strain ATCC 14538 / DSM 43046 / CBS 188.64 / JCM 3121 / NBRC 102363 / NCIMB 12654 / NRRL B-3342 / UNCC 431) TaxID=512565 RepID=I0HAV4_ACTM4|nr:DUF6493 family protein [Actinoplanes missouriensis]BAL90141.1 hypothetical protein AMIS_49210 [Actinoplanes missouriensis 431]